MSESKIQISIKNRLKKAGWVVVKVIQLSDNGYPDLLCMKEGKTVWIEVKDKGKKPNKLQSYRIKQLNDNGFTAFYTDNINDSQILNLLY